MKAHSIRSVRCAIYTRVSTEHGLDEEFTSLDAQYDAASAYIKSQAHAGWTLIRSRYDDGGYSGGSTDRPDLQKLLEDIRARKIDVIVVYKADRLTRSLADFAKLVELSDAHGVSFVSVTQQCLRVNYRLEKEGPFDPGEMILSGSLARKRVTVIDYPDGRLTIRYNGVDLPYRTFDKRPQVNHAAIVENKRLGPIRAYIAEQQKKLDMSRSAKAPRRRGQKNHMFKVG